jgi:hypothetical protein
MVGALLSVGSYIFIRFVVPNFFAGGSSMLTGAVNPSSAVTDFRISNYI